jgi:predicted AAA+ superfamily ATPase
MIKIIGDTLAIQNPWWMNAGAIRTDKHIQGLEGKAFIRSPKILDEIDMDKDFIFTLRGPRLIGKTTCLKLLIKQLLDRRIDSRRILYLSLNLFEKPEQIFEAIDLYFEMVKQVRGRKYLLLDEISYVKNWQYGIKHIVDLGMARNKSFIITGSSAMDIRKGTERLPGRRGRSIDLDKLLFPVQFSQFFDTMNPNASLPTEKLLFKELLDKESFPKLQEFQTFMPQLGRCFEDYLRVGGFPDAINDFISSGKTTPETIDNLSSSIIGDIEKLGKSKFVTLQVLRKILEILNTPISWEAFARDTEVSANTVKDYIETLAESFFLFVLQHLDLAKQRVSLKKRKKFYPLDPLLYKAFTQITGVTAGVQETAVLAEMAIGQLLLSYSSQISEGLYEISDLTYWRSARQKEIDFLLRHEDDLLPIEVKYQAHITPSDSMTMRKTFKRGIVVSRNTLKWFERNGAHVLVIPAALFCYLLSRE